MAEFLIAKQDPSVPSGWRPITIVVANVPSTLEEGREIAKQGFQGPGRYAMTRFDNRREFNMGQGAPSVEDVPPPT